MSKLKDLNQGQTGPDVKAVQEALNLVNDASQPPLKEDGVFGPKTERAVKQYQSTHQLTPDGIVGPKTRGQLFPLGVATVTIFGMPMPPLTLSTSWTGRQPRGPSARLLNPNQLTLRTDLSTTVTAGLGGSVFAPLRVPGLTLPIYAPSVPDFSFQAPQTPGTASSAPTSIFGFNYDHLEVQPGAQSTFPFGGLRNPQNAFFLTMQTVYVRGDPKAANQQLTFGVTASQPVDGILSNGTPLTLNPFVQLTDVDRFGQLGMFHYWQPYAQLGVQMQGPGAPNPALTGALYPFNFGLDVGDLLTIAFGLGLAATVDLKSGQVVAGPQANFGLTFKLGQ
ncbi:MAG TPA: peptidoglycan-binding domain-containing protein [Bryobacteraceae bacterium]|nr:peptidoglycan-binding domain-containing protein [Bryobacteraceae bacterium]